MDVSDHDDGGWGGIRTHEGLAPSLVFKTQYMNLLELT